MAIFDSYVSLPEGKQDPTFKIVQNHFPPLYTEIGSSKLDANPQLVRPRIPDGTHEVPPVLPRFPSVSSGWGHMAGPKDEHECVEQMLNIYRIYPIKLQLNMENWPQITMLIWMIGNWWGEAPGFWWILWYPIYHPNTHGAASFFTRVSKTWGRSPFCVMNFRWISGVPKSFKHPARCVSPKGL